MEGLESVRLDAGRLDFARALRIALTQPDAVDRHFARLNPFSPAVGRREETVSPNPGTEPQYPQYSPGEEPVGACDPSDLFSHFEKAERGDAAGAVALLTGKHPVNLLRRILVPPTYRDEEEVLAWREHVRKAIQNLAEAAFDPREAYDALFALRTFEIAYQQFNDREILSNLGQILCHKIIGSAVPDLAAPIERRRVQGKLKLGYISENIRLHNGAYWALGWLRNHAEDIETSVICLRNQPGVRTEDFADVADNFYLCGDDAPSNARAIKELGLDVLIFTDIGMSGRNYRYASMRLAPVQCTAWGHPVTSGLPTIDYYLSSDLMEPPDGQDHYSESLVRLPNSGLCYERRPFPASTMTKSDFGLDDGPLYLSCQNAMKYLPRWDYLYREICDRTGRPIVFLEGSRIDNSIQQERMRRAGINAIWLPFLGNSDFLALIQLADVNLDTPGWNGGNTTVHCLSRGRPMVTLPGEFMRGRHSLAFCGIAGVQGLVASSPENYIALAANPDQLNESMSELNTDALFEDKAPVLALDAFFRSLF
jgi:predicted O-linked N-acetylglucosamine transferase (SPINDLY family)